MRILLNQPVQAQEYLDADHPIDFHRRLPGYAVTRLVEAPGLASLLGVGSVVVKDETSRFGLPAFKVLGASWATYAALRRELGPIQDGDLTPAMLRAWASPACPLTLVAATDGNHGRAVARVARWFGLGARIYVPDFVSPGRCRAIQEEGAELVVVDGNYDAAVDAAGEAADQDGRLLVSDTARSISDTLPQLVTAGYTTPFLEVETQLSAMGQENIDAIGIQAGVGGLASAATVWARQICSSRSTRVVVAEPENAACVLAALAAGEPESVSANRSTAMAVLQCGTVSLTALPQLIAGVSCCVAIEDGWSLAAVAEMGSCGVETGPSGAAGLAGLLAGLKGPFAEPVRQHLGLGPDSRLLVVATESPAAASVDPDGEAHP
ncbi:PLP-dependent lyase/thiolase [Kocuria dechangensis]|uniref:PLP-dependent lyase/thiolase n=1 Tax=Kocuria dechangensis TaxID=1176249 RepID=A0A917GEN1_9MICC|nr:diaminopropionate ammonia-lyase [Kocuria dechangensis]GGG41801.1 PLP-dependent lyase/thiolase [Kocuria dechangensis]